VPAATELRGSHGKAAGPVLTKDFGTADLSQIVPAALPAALERMQVDLGLESDRGRRFALWALLHMFGAAPDLDIAFPDAADREAARNFMDLAASADGE